MNAKHVEKFIDLSQSSNSWYGCDVQKWYETVTGKKLLHLPKATLDMSELKKMCRRRSGKSNFECLVSVMAWSNQRASNAEQLFNNSQSMNYVEKIIGDIRKGMSPLYAYETFHRARRKNKIAGLGISFYTRLIFFCDPNNKGYVLDQWTSKTVNLLVGYKMIRIAQNGFVTDANKSVDYNNFCLALDELARLVDWPPQKFELSLFASGGTCPWAWRQYVKKHYNELE